MPTPGYSLAGFMDAPAALSHFRFACMPASDTDQALTAEWNAARAKLGAPFANAGTPNIQPLPAACNAHVDAVRQAHGLNANVGFALVEIDPLLAFQFTVDRARSQHHCGALPQNPSVVDTLPVCLPVTNVDAPVQVSNIGSSVAMTSRSTNLRIMARGLFNEKVGVAIGFSLPLTHVVRWQGRCYLHNGFHRAIGCRESGATHMPCLLRDVGSATEVGMQPPGTFDAALMQSAQPPTVGHFTKGGLTTFSCEL